MKRLCKKNRVDVVLACAETARKDHISLFEMTTMHVSSAALIHVRMYVYVFAECVDCDFYRFPGRRRRNQVGNRSGS